MRTRVQAYDGRGARWPFRWDTLAQCPPCAAAPWQLVRIPPHLGLLLRLLRHLLQQLNQPRLRHLRDDKQLEAGTNSGAKTWEPHGSIAASQAMVPALLPLAGQGLWQDAQPRTGINPAAPHLFLNLSPPRCHDDHVLDRPRLVRLHQADAGHCKGGPSRARAPTQSITPRRTRTQWSMGSGLSK